MCMDSLRGCGLVTLSSCYLACTKVPVMHTTLPSPECRSNSQPSISAPPFRTMFAVLVLSLLQQLQLHSTNMSSA